MKIEKLMKIETSLFLWLLYVISPCAFCVSCLFKIMIRLHQLFMCNSLLNIFPKLDSRNLTKFKKASWCLLGH